VRERGAGGGEGEREGTSLVALALRGLCAPSEAPLAWAEAVAGKSERGGEPLVAPRANRETRGDTGDCRPDAGRLHREGGREGREAWWGARGGGEAGVRD